MCAPYPHLPRFDSLKVVWYHTMMHIHHKGNTQNMTASYLVFAGLGIIWGSNFLFMKMAVALLGPMQVVCLRVLCGSVPILGYALARGELRRSHWKMAHHFIIMALLANVLPFFFFVKGTQSLASGIAGVISGTIPLMTFLLTILLLPADRPDSRRLAGVALGLAGVALGGGIPGAAAAGGGGQGGGAGGRHPRCGSGGRQRKGSDVRAVRLGELCAGHGLRQEIPDAAEAGRGTAGGVPDAGCGRNSVSCHAS